MLEATTSTPLPGSEIPILEVGQSYSENEARKNAPLGVELEKVFALALVMTQDLDAGKDIRDY